MLHRLKIFIWWMCQHCQFKWIERMHVGSSFNWWMSWHVHWLLRCWMARKVRRIMFMSGNWQEKQENMRRKRLNIAIMHGTQNQIWRWHSLQMGFQFLRHKKRRPRLLIRIRRIHKARKRRSSRWLFKKLWYLWPWSKETMVHQYLGLLH